MAHKYRCNAIVVQIEPRQIVKTYTFHVATIGGWAWTQQAICDEWYKDEGGDYHGTRNGFITRYRFTRIY